MVSLYAGLRSDGLSKHSAWRAAFAIVPYVVTSLISCLTRHSKVTRYLDSVPILLGTAALTLIFGQDHPTGKWSQRHKLPATAIAVAQGHELHVDPDEELVFEGKKDGKGLEEGNVEVRAVDPNEEMGGNVTSTVDVAVNESLTFKTATEILTSHLTWLPALAYLTTFGTELILDAQMANVLFGLFNKRIHGFDQTKAGYYTSILYVTNSFRSLLRGG